MAEPKKIKKLALKKRNRGPMLSDWVYQPSEHQIKRAHRWAKANKGSKSHPPGHIAETLARIGMSHGR